MKNLDYSIVRFIAEQDPNGDIMEVWEELQDGVIDHWGFTEILQNILSDWECDLMSAGLMTPRVKGYYDYLGI